MAEQPEATHDFGRDYWDQHWQRVTGEAPGAIGTNPPNPHLVREAAGLTPGRALDAGCGTGAEAIWLATQGWNVIAADIASDALAHAARRTDASEVAQQVTWVEADLTVWEPGRYFDLVTTNYAHPATPQLDFYDRISAWVAPGGTLLIVGHLHNHASAGHGDHHHHHGDPEHDPPAKASVTVADITARLATADWTIESADEHVRTVGDGSRTLHDVVVRATRHT